MYRNKQSLLPVQYYNKLPKTCNAEVAIVLEPVIATGDIDIFWAICCYQTIHLLTNTVFVHCSWYHHRHRSHSQDVGCAQD